MHTGLAIGLGLGLVAITAGGLYYLSQNSSNQAPAHRTDTSGVDSADARASQERTAWLGLFREGLGTARDVYNTERSAQRAESGSSISPADRGVGGEHPNTSGQVHDYATDAGIA